MSGMMEHPHINPTIGNTLEVDHDFDEADSALGDDDFGSYTTSLASSILKYREENGRTYHAYKDGNYVLPNDERENDRLDLQHHLFLMTLGGKLNLAPISKNPKHCLDIGTGTGIWALDFADQYPSAQVVGTDLSPIQPSYVPPNLSFVIDDAEENWTFSQKFDFIHSRMMVGSYKDWDKIARQAFENMAPGGWCEFQDCTFPIECADDSITSETPIYKWSNYLAEAAAKIGRPVDSPLKFPSAMQKAGFVNVQSVEYKWPLNTWPKGESDKELGMWAMQNFLDGLQGFSLALMTRALGWTPEEVEVLLMDVRKDFVNRHLHGYWPIYVSYGQKPEDTGAPEAENEKPVIEKPSTEKPTPDTQKPETPATMEAVAKDPDASQHI